MNDFIIIYELNAFHEFIQVWQENDLIFFAISSNNNNKTPINIYYNFLRNYNLTIIYILNIIATQIDINKTGCHILGFSIRNAIKKVES
ncbi:MAG: hypothetical protein HC877_18825 [Thioploca sp.]|nr:hypothetical protein [Thioploca sp.]